MTAVDACFGPGMSDDVARRVLDGLGRLLIGDLREARPEAYALVVSPETAHLERRELLVVDLGRERMRALARRVERFRTPAGAVLLVLVGEDEPQVRALDLAAVRRWLGGGRP